MPDFKETPPASFKKALLLLIGSGELGIGVGVRLNRLIGIPQLGYEVGFDLGVTQITHEGLDTTTLVVENTKRTTVPMAVSLRTTRVRGPFAFTVRSGVGLALKYTGEAVVDKGFYTLNLCPFALFGLETRVALGEKGGLIAGLDFMVAEDSSLVFSIGVAF